MFAGFLWLVLRLLVSLAVLAFRSLQTVSPDGTVLPPLWPAHWFSAAWLSQALLEPLARWDVGWYLQIVSQGYQAADGSAQFHPLYPLLAAGLARTGLPPLTSLLLVSSMAGLAGLYAFGKLAALDLDSEDTRLSLILLGFFPLSFVLFVPYTEALFLLCTALSLYAMRHKRWWLAGGLAGLAVLARQQGILLALPLAWELWEDSGRSLREFMHRWTGWLSLGLAPAAYAGWVLYRSIALGDMAGGLRSPADLIYKLLVSPSAVKVVTYQILPPWTAIFLALQKLIYSPDIDIWTNLVLGLAFMLLTWAAWPHLRTSYRLYCLSVILISWMFSTGPVHPYMGLVRHLWLALPVFIGLARRLTAPWQRLAYVACGMAGMVLLSGLYLFEAWVL